MADQVDNYRFTRGPQTYDWDRWLNGRVWRLHRHIDFGCRPGSMRSAAHAAAKARGLKIATQVEDDSTFVMQAVKP